MRRFIGRLLVVSANRAACRRDGDRTECAVSQHGATKGIGGQRVPGFDSSCQSPTPFGAMRTPRRSAAVMGCRWVHRSCGVGPRWPRGRAVRLAWRRAASRSSQVERAARPWRAASWWMRVRGEPVPALTAPLCQGVAAASRGGRRPIAPTGPRRRGLGRQCRRRGLWLLLLRVLSSACACSARDLFHLIRAIRGRLFISVYLGLQSSFGALSLVVPGLASRGARLRAGQGARGG